MIEPKYHDIFKSRLDVAREFEEGAGNKYGAPDEYRPVEGFPTDNEILYAGYEYQDYSGSAFVLYERDGKLYEVNGSHCSCYGLEGQWRPEETSWAALAMREPSNYGAPSVVIDEAKRRLEAALVQ